MKKKITHKQYALMYLRRGSGFGGAPVEVLVKEAADAIDSEVETTGPRGIGPALGNVRQAILLLTDAYGELSMALAEHQAKLERPRKRKRA